MSRTWATILTFVAAALAAIVAAPEFVELPSYIRVIIAALIAGCAAVGIPASTQPPRRR